MYVLNIAFSCFYTLNIYWSLLPYVFFRHTASIFSVFKLVFIGLIILGKNPFAFFRMEAPGSGFGHRKISLE